MPGFQRDRARDRHGLDQRQAGHCNCDAEQFAHGVKGEVGHRKRRERAGESADGLDAGHVGTERFVQRQRSQAADQHGHDHVGNPGDPIAHSDARQQRNETDQEDVWVDLAGMSEQGPEDAEEHCAMGNVDAEEVLDLAGDDQQSRPRSEADNHGVGNEIHQGAKASHPHHQLHQADHEGQGQYQAHIGGATGFGD